MTQVEVLKRVLDLLDAHGVPYMITGSFASNYHGSPRATQDADIVIEIDAPRLERLLAVLQDEFYVSEEAAHEALQRREMFNVVHFDTGFKIDLIIRKDRPYSEQEFERRQEGDLLGRKAMFASAEDTILSKLEWSSLGASERQSQDALKVALVQGDRLDWAYLNRWAKVIGVEKLLQRLRREAGLEAPAERRNLP